MEWTESLRAAISYMESHILDNITADDVAQSVHISSFYLQKGFKIMTGYTITEYIRYRRLYLAALDVISDRERVIDIAYKYSYETPESFTKAFTRFHGVSPMQMKGNTAKIKTFLPLKINIVIQGGNNMDYKVEKMEGFKVIGFEKIFSFDTSYVEIPKFWNEIMGKYSIGSVGAESELGEVIMKCHIGEFGVCIDDIGEGKFRYLIAGKYNGGDVPDGMTLFEFPNVEWAKFHCIGPMPGSLQSVNTKVFNEWLPGNPDYSIAFGANIEWYSMGDTSSMDYESAIWIPVVRKSE